MYFFLTRSMQIWSRKKGVGRIKYWQLASQGVRINDKPV
jgi:hypothetical protein